MRFITSGDFVFPFEQAIYLTKHLYSWSFQSGASNPDGIIRLPSKLLNLVTYHFIGSMWAGYIYYFGSFLVAFLAFWYFSKQVLGVKNKLILAISSTFFAFNPIFLGNSAKIGLVLAAAMLPLCITFLHKLFLAKKFVYLILLFFALNVSFLHPFTFFVNAGISFVYFSYLSYHHWSFAKKYVPKFLLGAILFLLLNAYFILPLASVGSIDKSTLQQDLSSTPNDYSSLISVANTGDFVTGFSLSKNVFLDFNFYNDTYKPIYISAAFGLYVILLIMYLRAYKSLRRPERIQLGTFLVVFLLFVALATVFVLGIDKLLIFLTSLPGGWIFRSPLKWQLYIPMFLFGYTAILLNKTTQRDLKIFASLLIGTGILINGYLVFDISNKLLKPRDVRYFSELLSRDMEGQNLLFIESKNCYEDASNSPEVYSELNVILSSKNIQVKKVDISGLGNFSLPSFDNILTCGIENDPSVLYATETYFEGPVSFHDNFIRLFHSNSVGGYAKTSDYVFGLRNTSNLSIKHSFVQSQLGESFNFVAPDLRGSELQLIELFDQYKVDDIGDNAITDKISLDSKKYRKLYVRNSLSVDVNLQDESNILLTKIDQDQPVPIGGPEYSVYDASNYENTVTVTYNNDKLDLRNILNNGSFETGAWQSQVSDCYDFDNQPEIKMSLDNSEYTDGRNSLKLEAARHIACTSTKSAIDNSSKYLLSFDHKANDSKRVNIGISYNSQSNTVVKSLQLSENWMSDEVILQTPADASEVTITLYGYPSEDGTKGTTYFDNFELRKVPDLAGDFFLVDEPLYNPNYTPPTIETNIINPTEAHIKINNITRSFYLITKDTFSPKWQLDIDKASNIRDKILGNNRILSKEDHFTINNYQNGWLIDVNELCTIKQRCEISKNGTYTLELTAYYEPQNWFYIGLVVSTLSGSVCIYVAIRHFIRVRKRLKYVTHA